MLSESSAFLLNYDLVAGYAGKWKSKSSNINQWCYWGWYTTLHIFLVFFCICLNPRICLWIQLPTADQLKTVLDKVRDFFGDAKESFGKITALNTSDESEESSAEKTKWVLLSWGSNVLCISAIFTDVKVDHRTWSKSVHVLCGLTGFKAEGTRKLWGNRVFELFSDCCWFRDYVQGGKPDNFTSWD